MRCFAYSFSRIFNKNILETHLDKKYSFKLFDDVYHLAVQEIEGDVFIFPFGAIVFWGVSQELEKSFCEEISKCLAEDRLGAEDDDLYTYTYLDTDAPGDFTIHKDKISLPQHNKLSIKLACSHGLAQSVKLGGFEEALQQVFSSTIFLPERLAAKGSISLSRKAIRRLMGRLFVDRTSINLHLELLDAPNFFWENTELEPIHEKIIRYVDLKNRVQILNQRLNVIQDLLDMLTTELNHQHSSMLEWTIIILIATEIGLILLKEVWHLF